MIRVLIADDEGLVRAGFAKLFDAEPDVTVVGTAADGLNALALAERERPDVVLMDIRMPALDGIEATRRLTATADPPRVLVLTTFGLDEYVFAALRAGASGFMVKDAPPEDLVEAVRVIARGDSLLAPQVTRSVIEAFTRVPQTEPGTSPPPELTDREQEVLMLLARGCTNAEIQQHLVISEGTAKTHVGRVLAKLGLRDRVQAAIYAYEQGLIRPGDR